jgi:hypothetical protein
MKQASLPPIKTVYRALENAAVDLYGFAVVCHGGANWLAEPDLLDSLLLGLENVWFIEGEDGQLSHEEFREEIFKALWHRCQEREPGRPRPVVRVGTDVPMGHEEMAFYHLPQLPRAALYLRTKKRFSYSSIALVLSCPEVVVRSEVEKAREFLLGRRVKAVDWSEDNF